MQQNEYKFLEGGGEMGALIRAHDWSQTSLGSPDQWPVSLRTTIGIVLNSRFPMFMYWGPDLICFYNDAYRPSLGINGKHPTLLGQPGKIFWAEIWHILEPMINQVLSGGGATWSEDQLIPFYRNGTIEDIYWTFSYSPVIDENGYPSGIIVACTETTEKVQSLNKIKESKNELEFAIDAAELATWDLNPLTNKFIGNERIKHWFGLKGGDEIELTDAINAIAPHDRERVAKAISNTLQPSSGGKYDIEYTIIDPHTHIERIVRAKGKAQYNEEGVALRFNGTLQDITEEFIARRKTEDAEERARLALEAAEMGTFDLNLINGQVFSSPRFNVIFGEEEPSGHGKYLAKLHPDDRYNRERAYAQGLKTGNLYYTARVIWADGSIHWIEVEGKVYYDDARKPVRLLGTVIDITKQKNNEEELIRFKFMADNASDMFMLTCAEGLLDYLNPEALEQLGYTAEEAESLQLKEVDVLFNEDAFQRSFQLAQKEIIPPFETVYRRKNGSVYPVEINMVGLTLAEKPYLFAVGRDITERKKAREEQIKTNQRLEIALEAGRLGSYELELATGLMTCTPQCKANYGIAPSAQFNFPDLMAVILPEYRDMVEQKVTTAVANHSVYTAEYQVKWPNGTIHWVSASGKASYDESDKAMLMVGVTIDITEQRLLQLQKDEFIGIASHELKTPVTSIKAYTQVLERILTKKGDTQEAGMIQKMDAQLNRLTSLIADLLDVTKINSGRLQFNYTWFDFNELITEVVEDLQRTTQKHTLSEDTQPTGNVYADKDRISQVLVNLITNAIKYSPHSKDIIVGTRLNNDEVVVSVKDFGIGISKEKQQRVFEQFYRVSGAKQHTFPGLGLGLYISSEIIKREGGRIWVDSEEGKGSIFYFSLPVNRPVNNIG
ncbi:PAS domain-containing protein [Mucilaginibacter aquaedulcis]|uniref:PAS domain-containing protein n=1 Tax=Mucilaginibacter aquaedulcis TaxID=1187081 RepID=UPI0025B55AB2|nr:PAS domain-containing protein [Mucilaginibacter aquaedulcis]MDN3547007.1 PAS domain-containing protein [Mucilaginibacter aquaedulcis]